MGTHSHLLPCSQILDLEKMRELALVDDPDHRGVLHGSGSRVTGLWRSSSTGVWRRRTWSSLSAGSPRRHAWLNWRVCSTGAPLAGRGEDLLVEEDRAVVDAVDEHRVVRRRAADPKSMAQIPSQGAANERFAEGRGACRGGSESDLKSHQLSPSAEPATLKTVKPRALVPPEPLFPA